ncbi:hypothetical protein [Chryseobacterium sp. GVT01B]|uniref:hypothetical protein n=1 Tax=Chryseobacterium sp. GVT01B TaxID=2862675 RepID=UPI001CBF5643|nr:hypothetical protein [Chryseobacterium sp. GVT01B]
MKKKLLSTILITAANILIFSQVGINNATPKATLDIVGKPTDNTTMDGIIPPRITGDQLHGKTYTTAQKGAVVYATSAASDTNLTGQTINVKTEGMYYFNGHVWIRYTTSSTYMSASVGGGTEYTSNNIGGWGCSGALTCGPTAEVLRWKKPDGTNPEFYDPYGLFVGDGTTTHASNMNGFKIQEDGLYQISSTIIIRPIPFITTYVAAGAHIPVVAYVFPNGTYVSDYLTNTTVKKYLLGTVAADMPAGLLGTISINTMSTDISLKQNDLVVIEYKNIYYGGTPGSVLGYTVPYDNVDTQTYSKFGIKKL